MIWELYSEHKVINFNIFEYPKLEEKSIFIWFGMRYCRLNFLFSFCSTKIFFWISFIIIDFVNFIHSSQFMTGLGSDSWRNIVRSMVIYLWDILIFLAMLCVVTKMRKFPTKAINFLTVVLLIMVLFSAMGFVFLLLFCLYELGNWFPIGMSQISVQFVLFLCLKVACIFLRGCSQLLLSFFVVNRGRLEIVTNFKRDQYFTVSSNISRNFPSLRFNVVWLWTYHLRWEPR